MASQPVSVRDKPPMEPVGKPATLWRRAESGKIVCTACARYCSIAEGQTGLCGIRGVLQDKLWLYVYGKIITGNVDPIEKKPVMHYRPGSKIFSIATTGCNWLCRYCLHPREKITTMEGDATISTIFKRGRETREPEVRVLDGLSVLTHQGRYRSAVKAFEHLYSGPMVRIGTVSGESVTCTPNHGLFVSRKEGSFKVPAGRIRPGHLLVTPGMGARRGVLVATNGGTERDATEDGRDDQGSSTVRRIAQYQYAGPVYNLEVEEDHSYTANGLAVANCQNFDISQRRKIEGIDVEPADVVRMTLEQGCQGLAYTYNQPTIWMEFARDIGVAARRAGIFNVFVSNGYDTPETVGMMNDFLDCITVDFKGSGETNFVRKYINIPNADPIFQTILEMRDKTKVHIEITDLIVPKVGDDLEACRKLAKWVYDELGPDCPIHFLRFHPDYKMMDFEWTPVETLVKHCEVAKAEGLRYAYIGNVPGHPYEHTYCPSCHKIAVKRHGFDITGWYLDKHNKCKQCGTAIPIRGRLEKTAGQDRFYNVLFHR